MKEVTIIGVDLAKNAFQLHGAGWPPITDPVRMLVDDHILCHPV